MKIWRLTWEENVSDLYGTSNTVSPLMILVLIYVTINLKVLCFFERHIEWMIRET